MAGHHPIISHWSKFEISIWRTTAVSILRGPLLMYPTESPDTNTLLKIWSAEFTRKERPVLMDVLKLPETAIDGYFSSWLGLVDSSYPSNEFFVRESYHTAVQRLFEFDAAQPIEKVDKSGLLTVRPMLVAGSSGVGKTFFSMYFIWRLFHADGVNIYSIPDTIVYKPQPDDRQAYVYHRGCFYSCPDMEQWIKGESHKEMHPSRRASGWTFEHFREP
jgi:hypothetical protein